MDHMQGVVSSEAMVLWVLFLLVIAYVRFIRRKTRAIRENQQVITEPSDHMGDTEIDRYSRHIILREIGGQGQARLRRARVLVIGAGGLGSPVLSYLAAAGVGTIGVVDDDVVSNSNLQRQVLFDEDQLNMPKVFAAQKKLSALNPFVDVLPYNRRISGENAAQMIADFDLVLDGCDNFETRALVNAQCVAAGVPLISGAITQWEGQVSLFEGDGDNPCYACIFPTAPADGLAPSCAEAGVMGALPGIIGSIMATEAIKQITGAGKLMRGEMLIFDALYAETRKVKLHRNPECPVCGAGN